MSDRDCENCKHYTEKGCDSWDCKFEQGMKRKEIIEMLKVLKEQALKSHNDTAIIDVKKDSFIYVMNVTINSLEIDERYELEYENAEEIHREKEQAYMQGYEDACKKYRQEHCGDAVSRMAINNLRKYILVGGISTVSLIDVNKMPSVNPQEPKTDVLDKIRAEIEKLADDEWNKQVGSVSQGLEDAIEIIDKYKAESEEVNDTDK